MPTLESIDRTARWLAERRTDAAGPGAEAAPGTDWRTRAEVGGALGAVATGFAFGRVRVEARGDGRWSVVLGRSVLSSDGSWEYEPLPSSRDDAFLARTRHPLDVALRLGTRAGLAEDGRLAARGTDR